MHKHTLETFALAWGANSTLRRWPPDALALHVSPLSNTAEGSESRIFRDKLSPPAG